jgi:hypothetical protein
VFPMCAEETPVKINWWKESHGPGSEAFCRHGRGQETEGWSHGEREAWMMA